jgi:RNA polymerase sigma factor (sigma-70 family)
LELDDLYRKAAAGDSSSEEEFFRRLTVSFRVIAQQRVWDKCDSEEVVQNALLTVVQKYKRVEIESSIAGWTYNVLNNKIMDYAKSRKVRQKRPTREIMEQDKVSSANPDPLFRSRLLDCLRKVGGVNTRFARILNLHYHGFDTKEICRKLDVKPNNLYVILSRARSLLESCLNNGEIR